MSIPEQYLNQKYPFSGPFTGIYKTNFDAKIKTSDYIMGYFTNQPDYEQVQNVTLGKTYHIYKVQGYGDVSDFYFKDDANNEHRLGSFFFEP